jgi:uncharacterized protein (TIGR04255 family)
MPDTRHYPRAPISEAIIDLRVAARDGLNIADLESVRKDEEAAYPESSPLEVALTTLKVGPGVAASATSEHVGYRFVSADRKVICLSQKAGFTLSHLAPYDHWESFRDEARRLWRIYRTQARPAKVKRLAMRYINRIDIPAKQVELKDYFQTLPQISPALPQTLSGFFLQLRLPQPDLHGQVLINQTITPPAVEGAISVVLDIDLFRDNEVPQEETALWEAFEGLRTRKNEIFEACITDQSRELFQ